MQQRFTAASKLFLRLLALCYLFAFLSYWIQAEGLVGPNGILPAHMYLETVSQQFSWYERIWLLPTLCWLSASSISLHLQFLAGTLFSLALLFGYRERVSLFGSWLLYLSLSVVGQVFFSFQWDALLLETGLLALFIAPTRSEHFLRASFLCGHFLLKWLLFRLMFFSGLVKLLSGDTSWSSLTALQYHYFTQPIPNIPAYYLHRAPDWFHSASAAIMFFIELVLPFAIFGPRIARLIAAGGFLFLQLLIATTGNYAFFNLLTIALSLLLIDDAVFQRCTPKRFLKTLNMGTINPTGVSLRMLLSQPLALLLFVLSCFQAWTQLFGPNALPQPLAGINAWTASFRSVNRYGLFAVMTTERPEIIIEGSNDLEQWQPYVFRWKPQRLNSAPPQVAPHQPRLDWQMWFAALGTYRQNPWLVGFIQQLLQGSPEVLSLLAENPFPEKPPKYIRALSYKYRFTTLHDKEIEDRWWSRELVGVYFPPVSLD